MKQAMQNPEVQLGSINANLKIQNQDISKTFLSIPLCHDMDENY